MESVEREADNGAHSFGLHGLHQIVVHLKPFGGGGQPWAVVSGDQNNVRRFAASLKFFDQLQPVDAGHHEIGNQHVDSAVANDADGFLAAAGGADFDRFLKVAQGAGQHGSGIGVIVNDEDAGDFVCRRGRRSIHDTNYPLGGAAI